MSMPDLQALRTESGDRLRFNYFEDGVSHYVAGRFAYFAISVSPVAANLFHNAIERFLKGCLVGVGIPEDQRKRMDHKLKVVWKAFREHAPGPVLDQHQEVIRELDAFHVFRYPESIKQQQIAILYGPLAPGNKPAFHCDINDIDSLVVALHRAGSVSPKAMAARLKPEGQEMLRRDNAQAAAWV